MEKRDHIHEILLQYAPLMARIAATHEADQALREDLLQDISLAVWHAVENFRGDSSMKTFIARVAHNRAVDHVLKETRRQDRHNLSDPLLDLVSTDSHQHSDNTYDLMTAMRQLPLKFRQVISLQLEGFNQAEIAHTLGLNEANVAKRASRARVQLQKLMEQ
ncbi:RNA polymerase subunit sigma-70 [Pseudoalteromonas sp. 13-15]|uniref:RNA polymerase sigma factor n=1 Tax=Pseudoalteromonas TaxID=53246 RepID=UPI000731E23D|nr:MULTISPECIES: RNA polymerase sigma factor [Pseudoalteromonas]AUL74729.1 RNA polymerase subunit sigma-70 [Pseudoalteromonas sp. 13-15]WFO19608.1 RNA polymerase sigma factor [Pseudoalteromonas sp. H100]SIO08267.1 RNA polymerase sigma-70 factor, ECF subfamily [Pseudoalteromonas marina]